MSDTSLLMEAVKKINGGESAIWHFPRSLMGGRREIFNDEIAV